MKGFIKGILLTVVLALPIHGCAGEMLSISELVSHAEENALLEWNQTYEAHERIVHVNIPVIIPEVNDFPIIQVSAYWGDEAIKRVGLPKASDQTNAGVGTLYEDANILFQLDNTNMSGEIATVYCTDPEKMDYAFFQVYNRNPNAQRSGNWGFTSDYYYPYEINPETIFAEDNELSLADAETALKRLLAYYYGEKEADVDLDYVEIRGRARKLIGRRTDDLGDYKEDYPKGTYCLYYRQNMEGIPIYMEIGNKMLTTNQSKVSQDVALKRERISHMSDVNKIEFMDNSSFFMNAVLLKEEHILESDVPLASLDEIITRLEQEINAGRIRDVYALRLGYVCYLDEGSPDTYTLYPTWMCDCIYTESAKESIMENITSDAFRENFRYEQVLIDAQTCELLAGWIVEDDGLYHKEPITWDDL